MCLIVSDCPLVAATGDDIEADERSISATVPTTGVLILLTIAILLIISVSVLVIVRARVRACS